MISSPTKQFGENLELADLHSDVNTRSNIKTFKVETLAKLYLDSEPAQITDATLVELCDWLWGEFQTHIPHFNFKGRYLDLFVTCPANKYASKNRT